MDDDPSKPVVFEVDTSVFSDVLQAVGAEEVATFVESVVADIGNLIEHLDVGGNPDLLDAVRREAHHLSGGCRSLGLVSIGAICARIEADARERVDQKWPAYSVELAQQRQTLCDWWSTASADPRFTGSGPLQ